MDAEEWRDVPGYEGYYQVSSLGRVKSLDRMVTMRNGVTRITHGRMMKEVNGNGAGNYRAVPLSMNGKIQRHLIHRLVALAFIPNPEGLPEINHKDEDKTNNRVDNLEWCDRQYNNTYGTVRFRTAITQGKSVIQKNKDGTIVTAWPSEGMAAACLGIAQGSISSCCRGLTSTAGGFVWEFAPWA